MRSLLSFSLSAPSLLFCLTLSAQARARSPNAYPAACATLNASIVAERGVIALR